MGWRYTKMTLLLAITGGLVAWMSEGGAMNGLARGLWIAALAGPLAIVADILTRRRDQQRQTGGTTNR